MSPIGIQYALKAFSIIKLSVTGHKSSTFTSSINDVFYRTAIEYRSIQLYLFDSVSERFPLPRTTGQWKELLWTDSTMTTFSGHNWRLVKGEQISLTGLLFISTWMGAAHRGPSHTSLATLIISIDWKHSL